jgi:hypothetical protein
MFNKIENAQDELLREAKKAGNQICKLRQGDTFFVKARRSYSHPEDTRILYAQAFDALQCEGKFKLIVKNSDLELYEVIGRDGNVTSIAHAQELLLDAAEQSGQVFKVHSANGEYVQIGTRAINEIDDERIIFLKALAELMRHGHIRFLSDSKEVARYELGRPRHAVIDNIFSDIASDIHGDSHTALFTQARNAA